MRLPSAIGQDWYLQPAGPLEPAWRPRVPGDAPPPLANRRRLSVRTTPAVQMASPALLGPRTPSFRNPQPAPVPVRQPGRPPPVGRGPVGGAPSLLDAGGGGSFPPGRRSSGNRTRHRTPCRRESGGPPTRTRGALHLRRHGPNFDTPAHFNDPAGLIRRCIRLAAPNTCFPPGFFLKRRWRLPSLP